MGLIDLEPGTVFAGDFRIVGPIGRGGMGAVYEAVQLSTGRSRALKVMLPQLVPDAKALERFIQESQVTARIESEHVVQVVTAGVEPTGGTPWIALELLRGETLAERIERAGAMRPLEALEVLRQVCHAVGAAHAVGVVHRDLKPENIYLVAAQREGAAPKVKVLDFGIAKVLDVTRTSAQATGSLGSPRWMAPEQLEAGLMRPSTDVWALGLIAFYVLTAKSYWEAVERKKLGNAMMFELLTGTLEPASVRARRFGVEACIPAGFDGWFSRCVCREASGRFRDAREALGALVSAWTGLDARAFALGDTVAAPGAEGRRASGVSATMLPTHPPPPPEQIARDLVGAPVFAPMVTPAGVVSPGGGTPGVVTPAGQGVVVAGAPLPWVVGGAVAALVAFCAVVAVGVWAYDAYDDGEGDESEVTIEHGPLAQGCVLVPVSLNALTSEGEQRLASESQTLRGTESAANAAEMSGDGAGAQHARTLSQQMRERVGQQLRHRAVEYERWAEGHGDCGATTVNEAQARAARLRAIAQDYGG